MNRWRLVLLPFGAFIELIILLGCWVVALFTPSKSRQMMEWATNNMPSIHWYIGE